MPAATAVRIVCSRLVSSGSGALGGQHVHATRPRTGVVNSAARGLEDECGEVRRLTLLNTNELAPWASAALDHGGVLARGEDDDRQLGPALA